MHDKGIRSESAGCRYRNVKVNLLALLYSLLYAPPSPAADRDVVTLRPQDLGHHGAAGSTEGEAAAHRAAAGREGPGASRDGQGHQPHLRGGEGAGRRQGAARAGTGPEEEEPAGCRGRTLLMTWTVVCSMFQRMRAASSRSEPCWPTHRRTRWSWPISWRRRRGKKPTQPPPREPSNCSQCFLCLNKLIIWTCWWEF